MIDRFYRTFSEKRLTRFGHARRNRIDRYRLALLARFVTKPGRMLEVGPGHGNLARLAVASGWRYAAIEPSAILAGRLKLEGFRVVRAWVPPLAVLDSSCDVVYADQVLEHMPGINSARELTSEAWRVLRPGGVFYVVVPDYLKERDFFWDIDYTHNFVTTERRVGQLFYDGGFDVEGVERNIGAAAGFRRDLLAGLAIVTNVPGLDALSRLTRTTEWLFRVRKNLFETLTIVGRKPICL